MKRVLLAAVCIAAGLALYNPSRAWAKEPIAPSRPTVQIAILLDTSNSMDGLIGQAKAQLWKVVNEFIRAKREGKPPRLEVALFEYGKASLPPQEGFVRMIVPLTDDLDKVSEELFALTTNGGDEFCGTVIQDAVERLLWSRSADVYKVIFIAGNEPFTQGPVDFHVACRAAIARGIMVNTIFCGANAEGERTGWKDGAVLADGRYMSIDQNQRLAEIPAPQDTEIARLGIALNKTYIPYGTMGQAGQARQVAQDANAISAAPGALVARCVSKGGEFYCNSAWDLVDALKTGKCRIDDVKDEDLPKDLRGLSKAEREARVSKASKEREEIQQQILNLNKERETHLAAERKKQASAASDTLDSAIIKAIRSQATRLHFTFE